jgi:diguanylate cyclase (GGDEF)-like protein
MRNPYLSFAVRVLNTAIENLYTRSILYQYNQILSQTSIRDSMTGFYNRLGYKEKACRLFDRKRECGENLTVLFVDMDKLKQLNDQYGHECGDHALQAISSAIHSVMRQYSQEQPLEIRMGGDEFLVIMEEKPPQEINRILHDIEQAIPLMEKSRTLPYAPGVSIGYIITDMSLDKNLDDYVREADTVMYRAKRSKLKE